MRPIFVECTNYYDGTKRLLNMAHAQSIIPTEYQNARAIITFHPNPTEEVTHYITESYEELKAAIAQLCAQIVNPLELHRICSEHAALQSERDQLKAENERLKAEISDFNKIFLARGKP